MLPPPCLYFARSSDGGIRLRLAQFADFFSFSPEVRGKDFAMRKIYILAVKALNLPGRIYHFPCR